MNKIEREAMLREKLQQMKEYEQALYQNGAACVAGVDEVGRGPLAGPVVAAAVVLPQDFAVMGIDDSKKLSEKKREAFCQIIKEEAMAWGIGIEDHHTIDRINILEATKLAMVSAIEEARHMLEDRAGRAIDHILLDALTIEKIKIPQTGIVKGDTKSVSIAAASILAKVARSYDAGV